MSESRSPTRQRLIQSALHLFITQGMTETTTREIAEQAGVNEVTLFRQFGSKFGLLLAILDDPNLFEPLQAALEIQAQQSTSVAQALRDYGDARLQDVLGISAWVRSLVGESGQYSPETRHMLGQKLAQVNQYTSQYLKIVIDRQLVDTRFSLDVMASLLNALLLGYAMLELISDSEEWMGDRDQFLHHLTKLLTEGAFTEEVVVEEASADSNTVMEEATPLFLRSMVLRGGNRSAPHQLDTYNRATALQDYEYSNSSNPSEALPPSPLSINDLPSPLVREIFLRAKKLGLQDYALVYVLFGGGLSAEEIVCLERSQQISDAQQHLIQIVQGAVRQVPLNRWIMGHRYGSYSRNPLTQWLKSRKDHQPHVFVTSQGEALSLNDLEQRWAMITEGLMTPNGTPPALSQTQQTWCVEMLMKGMSLDNLSILSGQPVEQLDVYARRAKEKIALGQAIAIDQKLGKP